MERQIGGQTKLLADIERADRQRQRQTDSQKEKPKHR